jgi:hypothetical protein
MDHPRGQERVPGLCFAPFFPAGRVTRTSVGPDQPIRPSKSRRRKSCPGAFFALVFGLLRHLLIAQRFGGKHREYPMQKPAAAFGRSVVKDVRRELTVVVVSFLYD